MTKIPAALLEAVTGGSGSSDDDKGGLLGDWARAKPLPAPGRPGNQGGKPRKLI